MLSTTLSPLVEKLSTLLSAHPDHPVLVALDGRCGSGKTMLAQLCNPYLVKIHRLLLCLTLGTYILDTYRHFWKCLNGGPLLLVHDILIVR